MSLDFGLGGLLSGASLAMNTYGSYQQAEAQNRAAEYNAQMMNRQAGISRMFGEQAVAKSEKEATDFRRGVKGKIGSMRAAAAASGVKVDEGGVADLQADTAYWGEYDAQAILYSGKVEKWKHDIDAQNYDLSASMTRDTKQNPWMAGATTALGGASNLANRWGYW